jgi:hypothetical protein
MKGGDDVPCYNACVIPPEILVENVVRDDSGHTKQLMLHQSTNQKRNLLVSRCVSYAVEFAIEIHSFNILEVAYARAILFGLSMIDGSKFKAVNTRNRNFTQAKMQRRLEQIDESINRYLSQLDSADRQGLTAPEAKITRLNEKIATLRQEIQRLNLVSVASRP